MALPTQLGMNKGFYGDRLRAARTFQGLSLQELGDIVCTTRQYIQQLENESKGPPSPDLYAALAAALDVAPNFFAMPRLNVVSEVQCHFRSARTTSATLRRQAIEHGDFLDAFTEHLEDFVDLPVPNFPTLDFTITSPNDIERSAEACRIHWGLGIKAPITNMVRALENAGCLITFFTDLSDKIDAFSMQRKRPLIIRNPSKESACRMRFDLAHECGHIVMHEGLETGDIQTETEANRFASAFLLPRASFLTEFSFLNKSSRISWAQLAEQKLRWKVSLGAMIRRAYDLGMIDAIQYRNANIHLRKTGQSKQEIYDDVIEMEVPEVLKKSIETLRMHAPDDLCSIPSRLGVTPKFLQKIAGDINFAPKDFMNAVDLTNVVMLHPYKY
jgi:Zn-dependent peptidase ImmA (M78 family)/transcriptional regulator with XRE-family HTH domain